MLIGDAGDPSLPIEQFARFDFEFNHSDRPLIECESSEGAFEHLGATDPNYTSCSTRYYQVVQILN